MSGTKSLRYAISPAFSGAPVARVGCGGGAHALLEQGVHELLLFHAADAKNDPAGSKDLGVQRENGSPDIGAFLVVFWELSDRFGWCSMAFKPFRLES